MDSPSLEILVSTQNGDFGNLGSIEQASVLYINQSQSGAGGSLPAATARIVNSTDTGLSNSRNLAIDHAIGQICLIADNDVQYLPGFEEEILRCFKRLADADLIVFQIQTPEGEPYKQYPAHEEWLSPSQVGRVSSIEIAFRLESVKRSGIRFDPLFGLGAPFPSGEENIFLQQCRHQGLRILYVPIPIVVHPRQSSGSNLSDAATVRAKGAVFYRLYGAKWPAAILRFAWRLPNRSEFGFIRFAGLMLRGVYEYRRRSR